MSYDRMRTTVLASVTFLVPRIDIRQTKVTAVGLDKKSRDHRLDVAGFLVAFFRCSPRSMAQAASIKTYNTSNE